MAQVSNERRKAGLIAPPPRKSDDELFRRKRRSRDRIREVRPWDVATEIDLLRDACRQSFWTHFLYGFGAGVNPKGLRWIDESVHRPMAEWYDFHVKDWLKRRASSKPIQKHLAVLVHREVGKTTMISEAGQSWLHLLDPEISTYTGSENMELSGKIMGAIKGVMDGSDEFSMWPKLYGNWSTAARKWTGKAVTHSARKNTARTDPSLGTFAVETSITGAHPDAIFYDDPISYERLESDTSWLQTVKGQVESLGYVIQGDGLMVYVGTRYDSLDHMGVAFEQEGIASITGHKTDEYTVSEDGIWHLYFMAGRDINDCPKEHLEGRPTTPKVWSEDRLRKEKKKNPARYAAQIMNDPSSSETNPLTPDQIRQCVITQDQVPWGALRYAICCDFAFSDGSKILNKDETVYVIHGYPRNGSGDVYVVEAHGSQAWRAEDFAEHLIAKVQAYKRAGKSVFAITGETARGGLKEVARTWLANRFNDKNVAMPVYYEFERGGTKKYARLQNAATFWQDGHVRVVGGAPGVQRVMEQMSKIGQYAVNPRIKIDYADAHSDAFQPQLYQPMRRIPEKGSVMVGGRRLPLPGLEHENFEGTADSQSWLDECPRPPLR
jgi:hypothetical protein